MSESLIAQLRTKIANWEYLVEELNAKIDADAKLIARLRKQRDSVHELNNDVYVVLEETQIKVLAQDKLLAQGREIVEAHVRDLRKSATVLAEFQIDGEYTFDNSAKEFLTAADELNEWLKAVADGNG